jgi:very-short-patch-repair endonuclease
MAGLKFRRQHPIGAFFADFAYVAKKLVIEIDGEHHAFQAEADARRTAAMEQGGWKVVRFAANYALQNPEGIWMEIDSLLRNGS